MSYPHIPSLLHASCSHVLVLYILQEAHVKIRRLNVEFVGWQRMRVTWVGMVSTDDNTLTYINIFLTLTERIHMEDLGKMKKKLNIPSLQCLWILWWMQAPFTFSPFWILLTPTALECFPNQNDVTPHSHWWPGSFLMVSNLQNIWIRQRHAEKQRWTLGHLGRSNVYHLRSKLMRTSPGV